MLEVEADSEAELSAYISAAAKKFWKVWIRGGVGTRSVALYKPANAACDWDDAPGTTPVARLVDRANMCAVEFHVDLVLASLAHHVRSAVSMHDLLARMRQVVGVYGASGKAVADVSNGLVRAVPLLNECMESAAMVPQGADWRAHARRHLETLQLATLDELSALAAQVPTKPPPQERRRLSARKP